MASVFKPKGGKKYVIVYTDETGRRRKKTGATDKGVSERIGREIENRVALRRDGLIDPKDEVFRGHWEKSLAVHLEAFRDAGRAKGSSEKHVALFTGRAARVIALVMGAKLAEIEPSKKATRDQINQAAEALDRAVKPARLADLTGERVQAAIAKLKAEGRSLATCNHHRAAIRAFSKWCYNTGRLREDVLRGVTGYNAKEDPRHERRTISLAELSHLIEVAERGKVVMGLPGPTRALVYRLAVATGLRFSEISTVTSESLDFGSAPAQVSVQAAYTKNGENATLPLPEDVASDIRSFSVQMAPGTPLFALPDEKGAKMLRVDLKAAGIPYRDASGLVFDFHSLRCQTATLADAAGVSPRVVQKLMRHSTLELTGKYTRPRVADVQAASYSLPSLKQQAVPSAEVRPGTAELQTLDKLATENATETSGPSHNPLSHNDLQNIDGGLIIRRSWVRVPSPVLQTEADRPRQIPSKGASVNKIR